MVSARPEAALAFLFQDPMLPSRPSPDPHAEIHMVLWPYILPMLLLYVWAAVLHIQQQVRTSDKEPKTDYQD